MVDSMLFPMLQEGRQAIPMDLSIGGPHMDLTTDVGFCNSLFMIANLKPGSGALAAPVCGSWIFMTGVPKKYNFQCPFATCSNLLGKHRCHINKQINTQYTSLCIYCQSIWSEYMSNQDVMPDVRSDARNEVRSYVRKVYNNTLLGAWDRQGEHWGRRWGILRGPQSNWATC